MGKIIGKAICFFYGHKRGKHIPTGTDSLITCPRCGTTWKQGKRPRRKMRFK